MVRLENWSVTTRQANLYRAPELRTICLQGKVFGHPKFKGEEYITTSPIMEAEGQIVKTKNTTYQLGGIDPGYREWLRKERPDWDPENPVTVIKVYEN